MGADGKLDPEMLNHQLLYALIAPLCLPAGLGSRAVECRTEYLGVWEYRQQAGGALDPEGERLVWACKDGALRGTYFGLEREGEHGLYYTVVEVTQVAVLPNGGLRFTVPERSLFRERPKSLQEVQGQTLEPAGFTRDPLHLEGRIQEGAMIVTCSAKGGACPESLMTFHRAAP